MKVVITLLLCVAHALHSKGYLATYHEALQATNFDEVKEDLKTLFSSSQDHWPADYGNYGPFFIRLAWHCSGSYRTSDGRGGCGGGRQRFDPERSWDDNTNLDKARGLLWDIKQKYGLGLSWGDLFILAGTTAIEDMGGPVLGFCGGRIDEHDGSWSDALGPSAEQEALAPCAVNGECEAPLGSTTVGLIYVNPEGPMGVPEPNGSFPEIRDTFARMAMNDSETVALIGGGHAFGKTHGACPDGAGPSPREDPFNPWPGMCGTGEGIDAFTSGFEGPWTATPTAWDNLYFQYLRDFSWEVHEGPGGHNQWRVAAPEVSPQAPGAHGEDPVPVMMLTSDVSLTRDPAYASLVEKFASDAAALETAFAHAWYKLTSRDMGPHERCVGNNVPPAQPFQYPLPAAPSPSQLPDFEDVKQRVIAVMIDHNSSLIAPEQQMGMLSYAPVFVKLAWNCASTFRVTDYLGGCNGARIRHSPQKDWPVNRELDQALLLLAPVKEEYGDALSWADLIVLAGQVAIEASGGPEMTFCPGRTDAAADEYPSGSEYLEPTLTGGTQDTALEFMDAMRRMDLSWREMVALVGGGHSLGRMHESRSGFSGSFTQDPLTLSNQYFVDLLNEDWVEHAAPGTGQIEYKAAGKDIFRLHTDMHIRTNDVLSAYAAEYASDNELFLGDFAAAWTKMVNADRFDGPHANLCDVKPHPPNQPGSSVATSTAVIIATGAGVVTAALTGILCIFRRSRGKNTQGESLLSQSYGQA